LLAGGISTVQQQQQQKGQKGNSTLLQVLPLHVDVHVVHKAFIISFLDQFRCSRIAPLMQHQGLGVNRVIRKVILSLGPAIEPAFALSCSVFCQYQCQSDISF